MEKSLCFFYENGDYYVKNQMTERNMLQYPKG